MIATLNGAIFMGRQSRIGSVEMRKTADTLIVRGDPFWCITDMDSVEIVINWSTAYDSSQLLDSVRGRNREYRG